MALQSDSLYQTLLQINNILVREVTPDGLFRRLAKTLQPIVGFDRCSLSIYDQESDSLSWFARAEGIRVTLMDNPDSLRGPIARKAIAARAPLIIPHLQEYGEDKAVQQMLAAGLRSSMAFPLFSRGQAIGGICISFVRPLNENDTYLSAFLKEISTQVALAVENMLIHAKLNRQNEELHRQVGTLLRADNLQYAGTRFFYSCPAMETLINHIRLLAESDASILICGETGTGKEFVARFIHNYSRRKNHNFVKVNCPALSPTLFESELFGHVKGSFTGASHDRMGRFELADKGSIFLDEIGELDVILQAKLLHVLQDAKLERVGDSRAISVNARTISATNADLQHMMREGKFRRDLFYRLGVTSVLVPPLRDREGELAPMLHHLMHIHAEDMKCAPAVIHPEAMRVLEDYHWPGNVRELSNLLARLLILHPGGEIGPAEVRPLLEQSSRHNTDGIPQATCGSGFPTPFSDGTAIPQPASPPGYFSLAQAEADHIKKILSQTEGRISGSQGAAKLLGLPRTTLQYKLRKHGIAHAEYKRRP